ncbi:MAG: iron-sulfur cluster assembly protein, partial [Ginsengibacter sp.]
MTPEDILKALGNVQEPDLGKDLVTLNMVKNIIVDNNVVSFTIVLTTPACPMKELIKNACINAIKILVNKEAIITVNFTSNTTSTRKDNKNVLSGVKNIIGVVSGKGGVGKSTVASN